MADKSYKLTYFNFRALGEPIRYMFTVADVKYDDNRIERPSWPELKPTMPFGQMPVLEVNGKRICQSRTICRYLAGEFGLLSDDAWDNARIDMIADCLEDLRLPVRNIVRAPDEEAKRKAAASYQEAVPTFLNNLNKLICEKNNGEGYIAGDKMTWGDIFFAAIMDHLESGAQFFGFEFPINNYPKLKALQDRVEANPRLAAYIASRPQANF